MADSLTVVLAGPAATRGPLCQALERAGWRILDWRRQPWEDPALSWVAATGDSLDDVARPAQPDGSDSGGIAVRHGWALRRHWATPACRVCAGQGHDPSGAVCLHCAGSGRTNRRPPSPEELLDERFAELERRIEALSGGDRR